MFPQVALKFFATRANGPVSFEAPKAATGAAAAPAKASGTQNYVITVDSKNYNVTVADGNVKVNGKDYKVDLREASAADAAAAAAPAASSGAETPVEAPVAGTVLRYVRSNGDHVEQDEPVLILESMKMELEVKSKVAGTITYKADTGASVSAGQVIAVVS